MAVDCGGVDDRNDRDDGNDGWWWAAGLQDYGLQDYSGGGEVWSGGEEWVRSGVVVRSGEEGRR